MEQERERDKERQKKNRERLAARRRILGQNLRSARRRLGFTQEHVAELLGISPEVYGRMERGKIFPRMDRFMDICERLGESPDRLLGFASPGPVASGTVPRQEEWLSAPRRYMTVMPRLTQPQLVAVRRHMMDINRLLIAFIEAGAGRAPRRRRLDPTS